MSENNGHIDQSHFEHTDIDHVFKDKVSGKFYYTDETSDAVGPYDELMQAKNALDTYVKTELEPDFTVTQLHAEAFAKMLQGDDEGAKELLMKAHIHQAPRFTAEEKAAQLAEALPIFMAAMEEFRGVGAAKFPTFDDALRFFAADAFLAIKAADMRDIIKDVGVHIQTQDDAVRIIQDVVLAEFFRPVPGTVPEMYAFVGKHDTLAAESRLIVKSYWTRYDEIQNGKEPLSRPGLPECLMASQQLGDNVVGWLKRRVRPQVFGEAFLQLIQDLQALQIERAASAGRDTLKALLQTGMAFSIEDLDEALQWFSTFVHDQCIKGDNDDAKPEIERPVTWDAIAAANLLAQAQDLMTSIVIQHEGGDD